MKIYDINGTEEMLSDKEAEGIDTKKAASSPSTEGMEQPNNTDRTNEDGGEFTLPTEFVLPEGFTTSENDIIDEDYFFFNGAIDRENEESPSPTEEDASAEAIVASADEYEASADEDSAVADEDSADADEDSAGADVDDTESDNTVTEEADTTDSAADSTGSDTPDSEKKAPSDDKDGTDETKEADGDTPTDEGEEAKEIADEPTDGDTIKSDSEGSEEIIPLPVDLDKTEPTHEKAATEQKPSHEKKRSEGRRVDGIFDFIELFVFTLVIVLFVTSFIGRHSVVDGDSMLGTLHDGETLIISDLFYEPRVGDIVVVDDHSTILKKPIIKRVIAVGGDTVRVMKVGIMVNGELLDEPYVYTDGLPYTYNVYPSEAYNDNPTLKVEAGVYYEFVVPEGELFVLGDHRNDSTDSRAIGTVDVDAVLGRVLFRLLPFDVFGRIE